MVKGRDIEEKLRALRGDEPLFEEQEVEAIQDIVQAVDEKCRLLRQSA